MNQKAPEHADVLPAGSVERTLNAVIEVRATVTSNRKPPLDGGVLCERAAAAVGTRVKRDDRTVLRGAVQRRGGRSDRR